MVDDFWGEEEWTTSTRDQARLPGQASRWSCDSSTRSFTACIDLKEKPQVPSIGVAIRGRAADHLGARGREGAHYRAIFDDKGRMMAIICHNTDLGDGWEREGEDEMVLPEFSERRRRTQWNQHRFLR
jgi:hypothetical protein